MVSRTDYEDLIRVNTFHQLGGWPHVCYIYRSETPLCDYAVVVSDLLEINVNQNTGKHGSIHVGRIYQRCRAEINLIHDSVVTERFHIYMGMPNMNRTHTYLSTLCNGKDYNLLGGGVNARTFKR